MEQIIGNARGSLFIYTKEFILGKYGVDKWNEVLTYLSENDAKILGENLQTGGWYPAPTLNRLVHAYNISAGNGTLKSIVPLAQHIAEQDLFSVFEMFGNLKNPIFVLDSSPSIWNRYFDTGEIKIEVNDRSSNHYSLILDEIANDNRVSGRAICTYGITTWLKNALIISGAKNVEAAHAECRYDGCPSCKLEISWG